ncbi:MAG TPA: hypothetical protein PK313_14085, partial [Myxococcota bacterium]|nr:hypothetical protein [Myxococcota bacterium]
MKTVLELFDKMRELENTIEWFDEQIEKLQLRLDDLGYQREMKQLELDRLRKDASAIAISPPLQSAPSVPEV